MRLSRLTALATACSLLLVTANAGGALAALNYNPTPLPVDPGQALYGITCPSARQCTAVTIAQELSFDPLAFKRPPARTVYRTRGGAIDGVWCPTTSLCTAVHVQNAVSFAPRRFRYKPSRQLDPVTDEGMIAVRCPSRTECVADDSNGDAITYDPETDRLLRKPIDIDGGEALTALACPSATQCTATDNDGYEITFQPLSGKRISGYQMDAVVGLDAPSGASDYELDAVSCQSVNLCAAVDTLGNLITFDPRLSTTAASWSTNSTPVDPGNALSSISCKPDGVCVAVDRSGNAVAGSTATQSWQLQAIPGADAFNSVACPTSGECIAVDSGGNAFRLYPTAY